MGPVIPAKEDVCRVKRMPHLLQQRCGLLEDSIGRQVAAGGPDGFALLVLLPGMLDGACSLGVLAPQHLPLHCLQESQHAQQQHEQCNVVCFS